ncbi:cuticle protein 14-like [Panonychus citri]|uniref:cuticle protein 14-like n=1 Tax=Panonychus citri TaxID=50023 RepID=UPI002307B17E|nr:cuticle protein 14-like [Panonychus citri]XP_053205720.1 cuticle protein 14-like [Panonychus citri]
MNQLVAIIFFALVAISTTISATNHGDGGQSKIYRNQDVSGKYNFGYDINDPWGSSNYRQESGDGWGNVHGSYGLKLADGRHRTVNYIADKSGFRVKLDSNEPSVDSIDSADAIYNGADPSGHSYTNIISGNKETQHRNQYQNQYQHGPYHGQNHDSWNNKDSWKQQNKHDNWAKN